MNMNTHSTPHASRSATLVWLLASVVGVTLIIAAAIFLGTDRESATNAQDAAPRTPITDSGLSEVEPTTPALPPPDRAEPAPPTASGEIAEQEATAIVEHIISVPFAGAESADQLGAVLAPVAQGNYLEELENQWQEFASNGWSVDGTPKVLSTKVIEATETTAHVTACIDASAVRTLDAAGTPIGEPTTGAAFHNFTLEQDHTGHWRITSHSFPNDPACS